MARLIKIYSRLNTIDDLLVLMLQPPNIHTGDTTGANTLVVYVDHVNNFMWMDATGTWWAL